MDDAIAEELEEALQGTSYIPRSPASPGASSSPQLPGKTPDRSPIPGHGLLRSPGLAGPVVRPLTQYGTAQEIMNVLPAPDEDAEPKDFEQRGVSFQENRKSTPWKMTPLRPMPNFALDQGVAEEPPALEATGEAALPEEASNTGF